MEDVNKNKFFKNARMRAEKIFNNNERLLNLIKASGEKLKDINLHNVRENKFIDRIKVIGRMIRAYKSGRYRDIQLQNILLMVAALLYFVTPIDLIPDFIPITGFVDDFTVVVWVYSRIKEEVDKFILWEKQTSDN